MVSLKVTLFGVVILSTSDINIFQNNYLKNVLPQEELD